MSLGSIYTNTATSPATDTRDTIIPEPLNFAADYRVLKEAGGEVVLTNINCPLTNPETIRIAFSEIADVFKGAAIEPSGDTMSSMGSQAWRKGASILVQMNGVGVASADSALFPYSAHLVLKIPYGADPEADDVVAIVNRLLGSLYDTGSDDPTARLDALLRGVLTPADL